MCDGWDSGEITPGTATLFGASPRVSDGDDSGKTSTGTSTLFGTSACVSVNAGDLGVSDLSFCVRLVGG